MPSAEDLFSNSKINLENEIEIIKSSSILENVIKNLKLNLFVEDVGEIMTSLVIDYPFKVKTKFIASDTSLDFSYNMEICL